MFKDLRLEVHSRVYFQLYILERTNHTSLKYILIDKRFTDEIKHRSSGHSFALSGYTRKSQHTLRPPPIQMDTLGTGTCHQPLLKAEAGGTLELSSSQSLPLTQQ